MMKISKARYRKRPLLEKPELGWSRRVPDREGIWLRLNIEKVVVVHTVTNVTRCLDNVRLMITWGVDGDCGFMMITPHSIQHKMKGWLWCGPVPSCPPNSLPITVDYVVEPSK